MESSNTSIQMAVLAALLKFGDGWAPYYLRKLIQPDRPEISSRAIAMAGKYRAQDVVPDLLGMLKRHALFKSDFQKNEEIIEALGRIGDRRAVPTLLKVIANLDNATDTRHAAAEALGAIADPTSLGAIQKLAADYPEVSTRRALLEVCGTTRIIKASENETE